MSIAKVIGERIRNYRQQRGYSQEVLAEKANVHPTYIGQLERGEKNATIESILKVSNALDVSLSELFENISLRIESDSVPSQCYTIIQSRPLREQEALLDLIQRLVDYKDK